MFFSLEKAMLKDFLQKLPLRIVKNVSYLKLNLIN